MLELITEFPVEFSSSFDYLVVVCISYLAFLSIYLVISPEISKKIFKSYLGLKFNHKIEWNNRLTSTIFSVIVSTISLYILVVDNAIVFSPLIYYSKLVQTNIAIVMGYTLFDMTIIIYNYKIFGDAFTLLHHSFTLFAYSYALTYSVMPYFANFRLICELSTPLVNMRWFLYAIGQKKNSLCFFINGMSMTMMFFIVRIAIIPIYWYKVYSVIDSQLWAQMKHFRYIMIVTCLILDIINIFWFKKMYNGALIIFHTNWQYYETHHKAQQLEAITAYQKKQKNRLSCLKNFIRGSFKKN